MHCPSRLADLILKWPSSLDHTPYQKRVDAVPNRETGPSRIRTSPPAGRHIREAAAAPRKSMGKLGAKLMVREQSRIGAADSIYADGTVQNPKNPVMSYYSTTWTAFFSFRGSCGGSVAFVYWPGCFFPKEGREATRADLLCLPCSTFHCHGEFRHAELVTVMSRPKSRGKVSE
jgi:hypothetical protein